MKCSHIELRTAELAIITSGNLGAGTVPTDKIIYTLCSNGTMVIEGEGAIFRCYWDGRNQPFNDYRNQIKNIIIGEGITSTTSGCFAHLKKLETVSFPSTLTKLPNNAFMSSFVETLTELTIPATVSHLGAYSFGHYQGDASAYFTDIIIENPNINIMDHAAVFNGGAKLDALTLYSYGDDNNVRTYAEKHGITYKNLDNYIFGTYGNINYQIYDGILTLSTDINNMMISGENNPWEAIVMKFGKSLSMTELLKFLITPLQITKC